MQGNSPDPHLSPRLKSGVHHVTPDPPSSTTDDAARPGNSAANADHTWTPVEAAHRDVPPTDRPRNGAETAHGIGTGRLWFPWWRHPWQGRRPSPNIWSPLSSEDGGDYVKNVLALDGCSYCGRDTETIDHIVPLARGGENALSNLTAACTKCNRSKGARPLLLFLLRARQREAGS